MRNTPLKLRLADNNIVVRDFRLLKAVHHEELIDFHAACDISKHFLDELLFPLYWRKCLVLLHNIMHTVIFEITHTTYYHCIGY